MKLYVGNLSYDVTEEDLQSLFASQGEVQSVRLITDKMTGRSKGFAFVEYGTKEDGDAAISEYDGYSLKGRPLKVNPAKPREEGGGGGGGPRRFGGGGGGAGGGGGRRFGGGAGGGGNRGGGRPGGGGGFRGRD